MCTTLFIRESRHSWMVLYRRCTERVERVMSYTTLEIQISLLKSYPIAVRSDLDTSEVQYRTSIKFVSEIVEEIFPSELYSSYSLAGF